MDFNRYFDNKELKATLTKWARKYPNLMELGEIGSSYEGRPILLATVTDRRKGSHAEKPAIWLDGNLHATEIAGTTTLLHLVHTLLTGHANDRRIRRLLESATFYVVPRVNPDGAEAAMSDTPRFLRSGVRAYPYPDKEEGVHMEDVDGDGRVLQMRIRDPYGDWKISSKNPRLMEKRGIDEHGDVYYRLLPEGILEDFDGWVIKMARPVEGLDFNRNFPFDWRPESDQYGAGPYPASEIEIRSVVDFISRHNNINIALTYHTFSGVILRPYGTREDDKMETDDLWVFQKMGKRGTEITGYPCVSVFHEFRYHPKETISGTFDDWVYDHLGMFSFTVELWDLIAKAGIKERKFIEWFRDHPHEEDLRIFDWVQKNADRDAYVDWYRFDHPQLGEVELGGWNHMYTWRNPPPAFMGEEAERNTPFVLALADTLPELTIRDLKVERSGRDLYHVSLVVENGGFLPTYTSRQALRRRAARPVRVTLDLPQKASLRSGKRRAELGHLEGRSNKVGGVSAYFASSPTDNRARVEWVVKAPAGSSITLSIASERAGTIVKKLKLQ